MCHQRRTEDSSCLLDLILECGKALGEADAGGHDLVHIFAVKDFVYFLLGALNRGLSAFTNLTVCPPFQFCLNKALIR